MMSKNVSFSAVMAVLLSAPAAAFMPSSRPSHIAARKSSLSMSAALIVQNKGGGHGELGTLFRIQDQDIYASLSILQALFQY